MTLGVLLTAAFSSGCADNCGSRGADGMVAFEAGAIFGVIRGLFGAGIGALAGHEDRYEISP